MRHLRPHSSAYLCEDKAPVSSALEAAQQAVQLLCIGRQVHT